MTARCGSCNAQIDWARTTNGALMPIDLPPNPDGSLAVRRDPTTGDLHCRVLKAGEKKAFGVELGGTSHYATCPNADRHRKSRKART